MMDGWMDGLVDRTPSCTFHPSMCRKPSTLPRGERNETMRVEVSNNVRHFWIHCAISFNTFGTSLLTNQCNSFSCLYQGIAW